MKSRIVPLSAFVATLACTTPTSGNPTNRETVIFAEHYIAMRDAAANAIAQGEAQKLLDTASELLSWNIRPGDSQWTGSITSDPSNITATLNASWLWREAARISRQAPEVEARIANQMLSGFRGTESGLSRSVQTLDASGHTTTRMRFLADEVALAMVELAGPGRVSLTIRDARGRTRCSELSRKGIALCQWVPMKNQTFTIAVGNESNVAVDFAFIHN